MINKIYAMKQEIIEEIKETDFLKRAFSLKVMMKKISIIFSLTIIKNYNFHILNGCICLNIFMQL